MEVELRLTNKHSLRHFEQLRTNIADGKNPNLIIRKLWNRGKRFVEGPTALYLGDTARKIGKCVSYVWAIL